MGRVILLVVFLCASLCPGTGFASDPRYPNTNQKDFMADAPWRVKGRTASIPFGFAMKETNENDLEHLDSIRIRLISTDSKTIYLRDFNGIKIDQPYWNLIVTRFAGAWDSTMNGKPITAASMGFREGDTMEFEASISGRDGLSKVQFSKRLRVTVGKPFPRPDNNWLYGDAHYHTRFTSNPYEWGADLSITKLALQAIDLDWIMTTDHASDRNDLISGTWDLNPSRWKSLMAEATGLTGASGLPFILGEEVACQPEAGTDKDGIHLLLHNNSRFISGKVDTNNDATFDVNSRLRLLSDKGIAFAAHPKDSMVNDYVGDIVPWSARNISDALRNPKFMGFEAWNTRTTMYAPGSESNRLDRINPFTGSSGGWPNRYGDANHFFPNTSLSISTWDKQLKVHLDPIRKIFIEGGSDAHGDLNYSTHVAFTSQTLEKCTDNALGRVRTLVYAPWRTRESVLDGLRAGHSIVTDGPVLLIGVDKNEDTWLNKAEGDSIPGDTVFVAEGAQPEVLVRWMAYDGKGIEEVSLIVDGSPVHTFSPSIDASVTGTAHSGYKVFALPALATGNHYLRAQCKTGIFKNDSGFSDVYRAYSNPLWFSTTKTKDQWVRRYNDSGSSREVVSAMTLDGAGNAIVTGWTFPSGVNANVLIVKYDSEGNKKWAHNLDGCGGTDMGWAIAADPVGNVYVTGEAQPCNALGDIFILKLDPNGGIEWTYFYDGTGKGFDHGSALALDDAGNVYVTGTAKGSDDDFITIKCDSKGVAQWVREYSGPFRWDYATEIAVDGNGNVYVTGGSEDSGSGYDIATVKYDKAGALQWVRRYNGTGNGYDFGETIAVDGTGNVYVSGISEGNTTHSDIVTIKYDAKGNEKWLVGYNGDSNGYDWPAKLGLDALGNVIVAGTSEGFGSADDLLTLKYSPGGKLVWEERYNGPANSSDSARALAVDSAGNVFVTGYSTGSDTQADMVTVVYDSRGDLRWSRRYNGPTDGWDTAEAVAVGRNGAVYVSGGSDGVGTNSDLVVIKYGP